MKSNPSAISGALLALLALLAPAAGRSQPVGAQLAHAEAKPAEKVNTLRLTLYVQGRLEHGDLTVGQNPVVMSSRTELYLRRISLGVSGTVLSRDLRYGATLSADQSPQNSVVPSYSNEDGLMLSDAYLQYFYQGPHYVRIAKGKYPLSRIYLTSSSRQLFAERPYYTVAWADVLRAYAGNNLSVGGKLADSTLGYALAVSQPWHNGDDLYKDASARVTRTRPFYNARIDWSPSDWKERDHTDARLGKGRDMNFGAYVAWQDLDYLGATHGSESRRLYGVNYSMHLDNLALQAEINGTRVASGVPGKSVATAGWFVQGGYFLPGMMLEPVLRYEVFDSNTSRPAASVRALTLGVNRYFDGNNFKVGVNYERSRFDDNFQLLRPAGRNSKSAIRATLQYIY